MLEITEMQRHCKIIQALSVSKKYSDIDHAILGAKHHFVPADGHI